jgi:hypothetical protein
MSYASYKFHKAVLSLQETESYREWLTSSYIYHLLQLRDDELPPDIKDEFHKLRRDLTATQGKGLYDSLQATVYTMNDNQIDHAVKRIVNMQSTIKS